MILEILAEPLARAGQQSDPTKKRPHTKPGNHGTSQLFNHETHETNGDVANTSIRATADRTHLSCVSWSKTVQSVFCLILLLPGPLLSLSRIRLRTVSRRFSGT